MVEKVVLSWSGGKDSALALHALRADSRYHVVALLTTLSEQFRRVSHHGVRADLLEAQASAVGLPLVPLWMPPGPAGPCTSGQYEDLMRTQLLRLRDQGVTAIAHGDIFLQELRRRREELLAQVDLRALFPLWGQDTRALIERFASLGFRALLCCVDHRLGPAFVGREVDMSLLADLPPHVDPCGEHGEYHSFVYAGPIFGRRVAFTRGEIVERDGRSWIDLLSATPATLPSASASHLEIDSCSTDASGS